MNNLKNIFLLGNFKTGFGMNFIVSCLFFLLMFFLTKPNSDNIQLYISSAIIFVSFIMFILFNILSIQVGFNSIFNEDNDINILETLKEESIQLFPKILIHYFLFIVLYNFIIPFIGTLIGSNFEISLFNDSTNLVTLFLTSLSIWILLFGSINIIALDVSFIDSCIISIDFLFKNILLSLKLFLFIILNCFIFQLLIIFTYEMNQLIVLPIKILIFAYLWGLINTSLIICFGNNCEDYIEEE